MKPLGPNLGVCSMPGRPCRPPGQQSEPRSGVSLLPEVLTVLLLPGGGWGGGGGAWGRVAALFNDRVRFA